MLFKNLLYLGEGVDSSYSEETLIGLVSDSSTYIIITIVQ